MPNGQATSNDAAKIMQAIQAMLSGVGQATGATGGAERPAIVPGVTPPAPGATIRFDPRVGAPPITTAGPVPRPALPRTGTESIGDFQSHGAAVNAGLISLGNSLSGIFSAI